MHHAPLAKNASLYLVACFCDGGGCVCGGAVFVLGARDALLFSLCAFFLIVTSKNASVLTTFGRRQKVGASFEIVVVTHPADGD